MKFQMKKTKFFLYLSLLLLSFSIIVALFSFGIFSNINSIITDNLYGGLQTPQDIIIIGIDDQSLQEIGRWPWNRSEFSSIIPHLDEAEVIGIDIGFYENSTQDRQLLQSIKQTNATVVLASQYSEFEYDNTNTLEGQKLLRPFENNKSFFKTGYVNILLDNDGVARALRPNIKGPEKSFSETIYSKYTQNNFSTKNNRYLINYIGPPNSFQYYSFSEVNSISKSKFSNSIVLIGATAPGLRDTFMTPTSNGEKCQV